MIISKTEGVFLNILRGTTVATAALALFVAIACVCAAGATWIKPEPTVNLSAKVNEIRNFVDPKLLIGQVFPQDSSVANENSVFQDNIKYEYTKPTDQNLLDEFNKFLNISVHGKFSDAKQFSNWISGNGISLSWPKSIDNTSANNEDNANNLWRSLLLDFAKRLTARAPLLEKADKQSLYPSSFENLMAPTGDAKAPYFLHWYFSSLQERLRKIGEQLSSEKAEWEGMRAGIPILLMTAAGAFGYFIVIMFMFLVVSIEASIRRIAEKLNE